MLGVLNVLNMPIDASLGALSRDCTVFVKSKMSPDLLLGLCLVKCKKYCCLVQSKLTDNKAHIRSTMRPHDDEMIV